MNAELSHSVEFAANLLWIHFWQLTLVAFVVWCVAKVAARNRPHVAHTLWLVVILKAITPPVVPASVGLFSWIESSSHNIAFAESLGSTETQTALEEPLRQTKNDESETLGSPTDIQPTNLPSIDRAANPPISNMVQSERSDLRPDQIDHVHSSETAASTSPFPAAKLWLMIVWLIGSSVCFGTIIIRSIRAVANLRSTRETIPPALNEQFKRQAELARVRARLWLTSSEYGPVAFGVLRPTIAIPISIATSSKDSVVTKEFDAILAHECAHLRRRDLWIGWLQVLAHSAWWFHPLIWIANRNLSQESERCCDEEAVGRLECSPSDYVQGLLDVLDAKRSLRAVPVLPGIRRVDVTQKRLERIMKMKQQFRTKTPLWCGLMLAALGAILLPGATAPNLDEGSESGDIRAFKPRTSVGPVSDNMPIERIRLTVHLISGPTDNVDDLFTDWNVKPFVNTVAPVIGHTSGQSIRKQTPVLWSALKSPQSTEILDVAQSSSRLNVYSSTETVRSTQTLTLKDITRHPFVVGMETEPIISTVNSGLAIDLTPDLVGTDNVRIHFKVELAKILAVERLTVTRKGQSPISIQVPEVARIDSEARLTIGLNETLLIGGIRHLNPSDGNHHDDNSTNHRAIIIAVKASVASEKVESNESQADEFRVAKQTLPENIPDDPPKPSPTDPMSAFPEEPAIARSTLTFQPRTHWDLSRTDCVAIALKNSNEVRSIAQFRKGEGDALCEIHLIRTEVTLPKAEITLRNFVSEVEKSYWELYFFYRNLDEAKVGRDSALLIWRAVNAQLQEGTGQQADAASVAQSQEQYFFFRGRVEEATRDLLKAERHLRYLCGLKADDNRVMRPTDEPDLTKREYNWEQLKQRTLRNVPEMRSIRARVGVCITALESAKSEDEIADLQVKLTREQAIREDLELELTHALTDAVQNIDASFQLHETAAMQSFSAKKQIDALRARFREGTVTLDFLLDAQRRLADARVARWRSALQYEMSKVEIAYRSNSLLSDRHITISGPKDD